MAVDLLRTNLARVERMPTRLTINHLALVWGKPHAAFFTTASNQTLYHWPTVREFEGSKAARLVVALTGANGHQGAATRTSASPPSTPPASRPVVAPSPACDLVPVSSASSRDCSRSCARKPDLVGSEAIVRGRLDRPSGIVRVVETPTTT